MAEGVCTLHFIHVFVHTPTVRIGLIIFLNCQVKGRGSYMKSLEKKICRGQAAAGFYSYIFDVILRKNTVLFLLHIGLLPRRVLYPCAFAVAQVRLSPSSWSRLRSCFAQLAL